MLHWGVLNGREDYLKQCSLVLLLPDPHPGSQPREKVVEISSFHWLPGGASKVETETGETGYRLWKLPVFNSCPQGWLWVLPYPGALKGTEVSTMEGLWISRSWDGGRAASQGEGIRAPDNWAGVGGFGRTPRQLGPGKVLPLPAPNSLGKVPSSGTPLHQATAGKWVERLWSWVNF